MCILYYRKSNSIDIKFDGRKIFLNILILKYLLKQIISNIK